MIRARIRWNECLGNPQALHSVYGADALPDLSRVELQEMLMGERRNLRIAFSVTPMPKVFPLRWPASSNRVHMTLDLWDIDAVAVDGWRTDRPGRLDVVPETDRHRLCFEGDGCRFGVLFRGLRLARINGYETTAS